MTIRRLPLQPAVWLIAIVISLLRVVAFSQTIPQKPPSATQSEERLAMQYFQQRDFEKAADILQRLFKNEKKPYLYSYYLLSLNELGRFDEAVKAARQMQKQFPGQPAWMVDEAYVNYLSGNQRKAEKLFKNLIEKSTESQQLVLQTANAFRARGLTAQALEAYEKGKKLFPNPDALLSEIASVYEMAGDFKNATDTYLTLLGTNPQMLENIKGRLQFSLAQDIENERANYLRRKLLAAVQKDPDNQQLVQLMLWYSMQSGDFETALNQAIALDSRFKNGGVEVMQLARIAASSKNFATSLKAVDYIINKHKETGLSEDAKILRVNILFAQMDPSSPVSTTQVAHLEKELRRLIKETFRRDAVPELSSKLAHLLAFYSGKPEEAIQILEPYTETGLPDAEIKMELGDIYLLTDRVWDANLMYAQAAKEAHDDEQGQEARFKQARLSYFMGEFEWARAQLDVLKSATSRLVANDALELSLLISENLDPDSTYTMLQIYSKADLMVMRNKPTTALQLLDSIGNALLGHPIQDEVVLKKALINGSMNRYLEADSLFKTLYNFYPDGIWAAKALSERAKILDLKLGKPTEALPLYQLLITRFGSSFYAEEARKRYREINSQTQPAL